MPLNSYEDMMDNEADVSIFDLLTSLIEMLADFLLHGFGLLFLLNAASIFSFKISWYCAKLVWSTLWSLLTMDLFAEPWKKDEPIVTETKKKRKSSSPSTDSSKVDVTEEWISESEGENERVESTTISFVDVSTVNCDFDDENADSVHDDSNYRECETSAPSVDLTSQQSDLHQMLLDMSRRMDEMQEKFDKRLQSVESQLSERSNKKNQKTPTTDPNLSASFDRSASSEEQEADSLTESQADAQSVDSPNPRARIILPCITSHVQNCYLASCDTCRKLRRISKNIETIPSPDANSVTSDERVHPLFGGGVDWVGLKRRGMPNPSYSLWRKSRRISTDLTSETARCDYCLRNYDDSSQLNFHLNRHTIDDEKSCCHCVYRQNT